MKVFILILLLFPTLTFAVGYTTLVGIPGIEAGQGDFQAFIDSLYAFSISIAALLAVIKIVIAGVKYMLTDIVTSKGEAKKEIQGALLGLLVVLGAVLILSVINPQLVDINLELSPAPAAQVSPTENNPTEDLENNETIMVISDAVTKPSNNSAQDSTKKLVCEGVDLTTCPYKLGGNCEYKSDAYHLPGAAANCYSGKWMGSSDSTGYCSVPSKSLEDFGC